MNLQEIIVEITEFEDGTIISYDSKSSVLLISAIKDISIKAGANINIEAIGNKINWCKNRFKLGINMSGICRVGVDSAGGVILGVNQNGTVFANGSLVSVDKDRVQGHGVGEHAGPVMVANSKNVFINGIAVCKGESSDLWTSCKW